MHSFGILFLIIWLITMSGFIVPIPFIVVGVKRSNRERAEREQHRNDVNI